MSQPKVAVGRTQRLADGAPPPGNRPDLIEALLPGTKPQLGQFVGMFLRPAGELHSVGFSGNSDKFTASVDASGPTPTLHLMIYVDGRQLPEVVMDLRPDMSGGGLVLAGAPDTNNYVVGADVVLMPQATVD